MWSYLTHFYSKQRITMPLGYLMGSLIVSQALGAPLAAGLMALDGHGGLRGWQWLFMIEGENQEGGLLQPLLCTGHATQDHAVQQVTVTHGVPCMRAW